MEKKKAEIARQILAEIERLHDIKMRLKKNLLIGGVFFRPILRNGIVVA